MPTYDALISVTQTNPAGGNLGVSNIPQTYDDLIVKISQRNFDSNSGFRVNSQTSTYSMKILRAYAVGGVDTYGSSSGAGDSFYWQGNYSTNTANAFGNVEVYMPNYASTSVNKIGGIDAAGISQSTAGSSINEMGAALWSSNTAITSFVMINVEYNTTITVYGVKRT